ncbi:DUF3726 domain-containing protein [Ruegeria sediminis]|nr:DUF3726 domain-containing protein [Ruegeria sediminis]
MLTERNDPTTSGFTPPATGDASLSGNEVEALCFKAARGAGMSWGLAEEAGHAARWLHARGLDGAAALLAHLDWAKDKSWSKVRPVAPDDIRAPDGGLMCPVALGAMISDMAMPFRDTGDVATGPVHRPILILPFIHHVCRGQNAGVRVTAAGQTVQVAPDGSIRGEIAAFAAMEHAELHLSAAQDSGKLPVFQATAFALPADTLTRLNDYAMQTTVPASDASRADAGSAGDDND